LKDISVFFKEENRNAISHIARKPTLHVYKSKDYFQVGRSCSAIEPFVEYFIRNELKIPKQYDTIDLKNIIK